MAPIVAMPLAKEAARKLWRSMTQLLKRTFLWLYVTWAYEWDWFCAEREYKLALELNPNYATAHHWYGEYLAIVGRFEEAIAPWSAP